MNHSPLGLSLAALVLAFPAAALPAAQSSFQYQGDGFPIALSETGQAAVLLTNSEYVLWDASGTLTSLAHPAVMNPTVSGMSADASTLLGSVRFGSVPFQAARWTHLDGWQSLGTTISTPAGIVPTSSGHAADASRDGSLIVGSTYVNGQLRPFLWTAATGMVELEGGTGRARQISDDGLIIHGARGDSIVRWDGSGHLIETIPTPAGSFANLTASGVSADGDHIVGGGGTVGGFVWNQETGLVPVGDFNACCPVNGPVGSVGFGLGGGLGTISRTGHLAVGFWQWEPAQFEVASFATVWTPGGGSRRLDDELTARGADLGGFSLTSAYLISSDGNVIAGNAFNVATGASGWFTANLDMEIGRMFCADPFINSTGSAGKLTAQGSATLGEQNLTLEATSMPPNAFAMAISSMTIGPPVWHVGIPKICLYGSTGRHIDSMRNTGPGGATSIPINLMAIPQPGGTISAMVGQTWGFQVWHRDTPLILSSNMTEGVSVLLL